jgi:aryl-alcohol dehydrogenase-like predicted oxidoreductase
MFRQRPADLFFTEAVKKDIGIIVRVPLASGLLTGRFTRNTEFAPEDHRTFNRDGSAFDKGETFAGIPFETGLDAVDEIKKVFPDQENLAPVALRWILDHPEVSTIIPGASKPDHLKSNLSSAELPQLTETSRRKVDEIYTERIKPLVHHLW